MFTHIQQRSSVTTSVVTGGDGQQVRFPFFFLRKIDNFGNILITALGSKSILILNSEYEFIHKISLFFPTGITMDRDDRIIVTSHTSDNCLQIF